MIKNVHIWLFSYFCQRIKSVFKRKSRKATHVIFCFADHFEPDWNQADAKLQRDRVQDWVKKYPALAQKHKDADGCHPKHTFFYPVEMYTKEHLEALAKLCKQGFGEVEVHLHHDHDTPEGLKEKLKKAKADLASHGLLGRDNRSGEIRFGFIHGNWALNNSRPDRRWCGVNNETTILREAGCYADFTYPSAPSDTQPAKINSLYYTRPSNKPKAHNTGQDVSVGLFPNGELMMVQGPLALNWKRRKKGLIPAIENGDIAGNNPPNQDRVDLWIKQGISVKDKLNWIFVKVHTHGAPEKNARALLGESLDHMFSYLEEKYNDGEKYILHYVSAREMYNIIKAAEARKSGNPVKYRDYLIKRPANI